MITKFKKHYEKQKKVKFYNLSFRCLNFVLKSISLACISGIMLITNLPMFNAFEAHVVNVTGQICYKEGETRTIGYWKTHPEITEKYLPINLEEDVVSTIDEAINIFNFNGEANIMENKLNAQLLAIKLNVAHYSINEYILKENSQFISSTIEELANDDKLMQAMWINDYFLNKDELVLSEIIHDADEMLLSIHASHELEAMMKLLDNFNNLHDNLNYCVPLPITLNEILPNPIGDDNKIMPEGEWVELYNYGKSDIDIDGWYLYNKYEHQPIIISQLNADNNGDTTDLGETVVPANGWLVVYINGMHALEWINNNSDEIRLYNDELDSGKLISYYSFDNPVPENKTLARVPDGIGKWYDPIPTPGMPNILEETLKIDPINSGDIINNNTIIEDIILPTETTGNVIIDNSNNPLNTDSAENDIIEETTEDIEIIDIKAENDVSPVEEIIEKSEDIDDPLNTDSIQASNDELLLDVNSVPSQIIEDMKSEDEIEDDVLKPENNDDLSSDESLMQEVLESNNKPITPDINNIPEEIIADTEDENWVENNALTPETDESKDVITNNKIITEDIVLKTKTNNSSISSEGETIENYNNLDSDSEITADEDTVQIQFNLNVL